MALTPGSVAEMAKNNGHASNPRPVVQLISLSKAPSQREERYRIIISDGQHFVQGLLAPQLNPMVHSGQIKENSIIIVEDYLRHVQLRLVQGFPGLVIILLKIQVHIVDFGSRIGQPVDIEKVAPPVAQAAAAAAQPMNNRTNVSAEQQPDAPNPKKRKRHLAVTTSSTSETRKLPITLPDAARCPITHEIMHDPATIQVCGHTFSKIGITQWFERGETTCPCCRVVVPSPPVLLPNDSCRELVEHLIENSGVCKIHPELPGNPCARCRVNDFACASKDSVSGILHVMRWAMMEASKAKVLAGPPITALKQGCGLVWTLLRDGETGPHLAAGVAAVKGHELLVDVLKKFPNDVVLQERAIGALTILATLPSVRQELSRQSHNIVLTAMEKYPAWLSIQTVGCGALGVLGTGDVDAKYILGADGINTILKAAESFREVIPQTTIFHAKCCGALSTLSAEADCAGAIMSSGGLPVIVDIMKGRKREKIVQYVGCLALLNLARHREEYRDQILEGGGVEATVQVMENCTCEETLKRGCELLSCLASSTKHIKAIVEAGAIRAVSEALEKGIPTSVHLLCEAFETLSSIIVDRSTANAFLTSTGGPLKLVVDAMHEHSDHDQLLAMGCKTLRNLALWTHNVEAIVDAGGLDALISAMTDNPEIAKIQEQSCAALYILSSLDETIRVRVKAARGREIIQQAMAKFSGNRLICETGTDALRILGD